jgi:hypothetical protein
MVYTHYNNVTLKGQRHEMGWGYEVPVIKVRESFFPFKSRAF